MQKLKFLIVTLFLSGIFLSCSSSKFSTSNSVAQSSSDLYATNNDQSFDYSETQDKKIIFSAFLYISVKNQDTTNVQIEEIAKKYQGYIYKIGTQRSIIRVKSNHLKIAMNEIATLGKVLRKNITGQDVTDQFTDYQLKLDNAEKAKKRYLELLAKAENVETILKVEIELERISEKIDLIKGKMNSISHLSEFSTITIDLKKKKKLGVLGHIGNGLYQTVKWLFIRN